MLSRLLPHWTKSWVVFMNNVLIVLLQNELAFSTKCKFSCMPQVLLLKRSMASQCFWQRELKRHMSGKCNGGKTGPIISNQFSIFFTKFEKLFGNFVPFCFERFFSGVGVWIFTLLDFVKPFQTNILIPIEIEKIEIFLRGLHWSVTSWLAVNLNQTLSRFELCWPTGRNGSRFCLRRYMW